MSSDKRRGRGLSAEERALWRGVTRSIEPMPRHRRRPAHHEDQVDADPPKKQTTRAAAKAAPHAPMPSPRIAPKPVAPPLAPLDRRLRKRVARGTAPIDARIDLHGLTQGEAHHALLRFLRGAQAGGARIALVVTGKGGVASDDASERGVLRRQVPLWLRLPEFRAFVVGFESAGTGHGGAGALYVRLRRSRAD